MNPRFFVEETAIVRVGAEGFTAAMTGSEAHHAVRVLRLVQGDGVVLLDGKGAEYCGAVTAINEGPAGLRVLVAGDLIRPAPGEPPCEIVLVQGVPKGDKLERIVDTGTEVGVTHFVPMVTERSVIRYTAEKARHKRDRLARVAMEAAKQSRRGRIPTVSPIVSFDQALADDRIRGLTWIHFWEEATVPLHTAIRSIETKVGAGSAGYALFIGPEGGFSPGEAETLRQAGAHVASMGPRILRTEVAGAIAVSLVQFLIGEGRL